MAFPYEEITALCKTFYVPNAVDQIYNSNWLTKRALAQGRLNVDGGTQIEQPVEFAKAGTANYDGAYENIDPTHVKINDKAIVQWKYKVAWGDITDADRIKCHGKEKVLDLVSTRMNAMRKTLTDSIGTGMYSNGTTDTADMDGLDLAIDTANTYAGIDQGTYSWWQTAGEDSSTTTITPALLQTGYGTCADSSNGETPTTGVTTQTLFNAIWTLFQPQQRYTGDTANVGWSQSFLFNGVPIVPDNKCTANYFYWLNESHIKIFIAQNMNFEFMPWKEPINQPSTSVAFLKAGLNLLVDSPRSCYKYSALTG